MIGILKRNKLFQNNYWMGVQDFPSLDADVFGDDTVYIPEALGFELCMEDWWPLFIAEDVL